MVAVIKIKIDQAISLAMAVNQNVIASNIPVLFAMFVKKADGLYTFHEISQDAGKSIVKIGLMIQVHTLDMVLEGFAFDKIEHANEVALFILDGISMHEIIAAGDQIQDASLFFRTAKTLELDVSDMDRKLFIKDELNDLQAFAFKVNSALHPKFDLVINSKPPFFGIMTNEIRFAAKNNHITIFHVKEICGVGMNPKMMGVRGGRKPTGSHLAEVLLR